MACLSYLTLNYIRITGIGVDWKSVLLGVLLGSLANLVVLCFQFGSDADRTDCIASDENLSKDRDEGSAEVRLCSALSPYSLTGLIHLFSVLLCSSATTVLKDVEHVLSTADQTELTVQIVHCHTHGVVGCITVLHALLIDLVSFVKDRILENRPLDTTSNPLVQFGLHSSLSVHEREQLGSIGISPQSRATEIRQTFNLRVDFREHGFTLHFDFLIPESAEHVIFHQFPKRTSVLSAVVGLGNTSGSVDSCGSDSCVSHDRPLSAHFGR